MPATITEADWKAMRRLRDELLASLCRRINDHATEILSAKGMTEHEKYIKLFRHIKDSDHIVAQCFNDWRRSTLGERLMSLRRHRVLAEAHLRELSEGAREFVKWSETL